MIEARFASLLAFHQSRSDCEKAAEGKFAPGNNCAAEDGSSSVDVGGITQPGTGDIHRDRKEVHREIAKRYASKIGMSDPDDSYKALASGQPPHDEDTQLRIVNYQSGFQEGVDSKAYDALLPAVGAATIDNPETIVRGLNLSTQTYRDIVKAGEIVHHSLSSWTTKPELAASFSVSRSKAPGPPRDVAVVLVLEKPKRGLVVKPGGHVADLEENEIIRPPHRLKIEKVVNVKRSNGLERIRFIHVSEAADSRAASGKATVGGPGRFVGSDWDISPPGERRAFCPTGDGGGVDNSCGGGWSAKSGNVLSDDDGKPLVLYHGTSYVAMKKIVTDGFKSGNESENSYGPFNAPAIRHGVFLTDNPDFAAAFGPSVGRFIARAENVADFDNKFTADRLVDEFISSIDNSTEDNRRLIQAARLTPPGWKMFDGKLGEEFTKWLASEGYGAATWKETAGQFEAQGQTYVVFNPRDVKRHVSPMLKSAVVRWKGDPTDLGIHAQDELEGAPVPPSGSGKKLRAMAAALLKEVEDNAEPAPTLYRGDDSPPEDNSSVLLGWTSDKKIAEKWAKKRGGKVYTLKGAKGLNLSKFGRDGKDTFEESEWIVRHARREKRAFCPKKDSRSAPSGYDHIDFTPPEGARKAAAQALALRKEHGRGMTAVGVARARDLSNGVKLSPRTIRRMVSFFARHEVDKKGEGWSPGEPGYPSAGRVAWLGWGGDAGRAWANKVAKQMDAADERRSIDLRAQSLEVFLESRNCGTGAGGFQAGNTCAHSKAADVAKGAAKGAVIGGASAAVGAAPYPPYVAKGAAVGAAVGAAKGAVTHATRSRRIKEKIKEIGSTERKVDSLVKKLGGTARSKADVKGNALSIAIVNSRGQKAFHVDMTKEKIVVYPRRPTGRLSVSEIERVKDVAKESVPKTTEIVVKSHSRAYVSKLIKSGFKVLADTAGALIAAYVIPPAVDIAIGEVKYEVGRRRGKR